MPKSEIRPMEKTERKTVLRVMRRAFPPFQQLFFSLTKDVLVATVDGNILGAVVLKTFQLPSKEKGGVIYWIFTDPSARGMGLGQALIEAGLRWLEDAGCEQTFAIVEGFNTSSSKLFATRGFSILPFQEQTKRFGLLGTLRIWLATFHIPDIGHFLWGRPPTKTPDRAAPQFRATLILSALIGLIALWRESEFGLPSLVSVLSFPLWIILIVELRTILMARSAQRLSLNFRFRMWESGLLLSGLFALAFGFYFPTPGSHYPDKKVWRYRDLIPQYGRIALAGALPALILAWGLYFLLKFTNPAAWVNLVLANGFEAAYSFALFDLLLIFFPFVSYNGRRIWAWQKAVWAVCAAAVITLTVLLQIN